MSNPVAESSAKYIEDILASARSRKSNAQMMLRVGDGVWCRFSDAAERKKRKLEHGTVIRVEADHNMTTYTVVRDDSVDYEVFTDGDFERSIFSDDDSERRTIHVNGTSYSPDFDVTIEVPNKCDAEEFIDSTLGRILSEEVKYDLEWEFVDGISG